MKMIEDIVRDMRSGKLSATVECGNCGCESEQRFRFDLLAERIEEAAKALIADRDNWRKQALAEDARANAATCENPSQVGNAARLREALRNADIVLSQTSNSYHSPVRQEIKAALSAPARNCDLYKSEPEAYQAYLTAMKNEMKETYMFFEPWLFAEVKGANDEQ